MSEIFAALKAGDRVFIDRVISTGEANPNLRDNNGSTLLHVAAEIKRNELAIIEMLLKNGWDVNSQNNLGATPLHYAALRKDSGKKVASLLLKSLANTQISTNLGHTPLHLACERYKPELVNLLLEHKASPTCIDRNNNTPIHMLLLSPGRDTIAREIIELLLKAGGRPETKNHDGNDALLLACKQGFSKVCQILIQSGGNPRVTNDKGNTLVHECAQAGHAELTDMLLDLEVPYINVANVEGDTPLHLAVKNNHAEVAASLIRKGASILARNKLNKSPVDLLSYDEKNIFAIKHPDLVKLLNSRKPKTKVSEEDEIGCLVF